MKSCDQPRQHIKKQRHYFASKGPSSQNYGFSSRHVWMWELDHKEGWALKIWHFWTVVLEKTTVVVLRVPWTARRSNQSILKEISPEYSLEGLMLKLKLQYFGNLMWRTDSLEKTLMEDEMVGWHHQLNGHEFEQAARDGNGQGSLVGCSPWGCKELHTSVLLNNNNRFWSLYSIE